MKISDKRVIGQILGRKGIAEEILRICQSVSDSGSYKQAIQSAGAIKALVEASTYDTYWTEKANKGYLHKEYDFEYMLRCIDRCGEENGMV